MQPFDDLAIPGYRKLDGVDVSTATPTDTIIKNIEINKTKNLPAIHEQNFWRELVPIAIVGGGPSLKKEIHKLKDYKYIIACGSVHDYLVENDIRANYCVVCDPDPIMAGYLSKHNEDTKYLVASQCDPELFNILKERDVTIWHLLGDKFDPSIYGDGQIAVGGGCTVGTRAMVIAMGLGFYNLHLFGMDTCLDGEAHHAYNFNDPSVEKIEDKYNIKLEIDGPEFELAGYHLGQLMDIKGLMRQYVNKMHITVHGDSLLSYFMEIAVKRAKIIHAEQEKIT